jgi:hypothetical protein
MICPKCGHNNRFDTACEGCGVIFEKYFQQAQRQRELEMAQWEREDRIKRKLTFSAAGAVLVAFFAVLYFLIADSDTNGLEADQADNHTPARRSPWLQDTTGPGYWERNGTQLQWVPTPGQPKLTALASNFVRLGDYSTFGFLTSNQCHAIFGKDLSDRSKSEYSNRKSVEQFEYDNLSDRLKEAELLYEEQRVEFVNSCKVCDKKNFDRKLGKYRSKVDKLKRELAVADKKLDLSQDMIERNSRLSARIGPDSFDARLIETSDRYPLSLVLLDKPSCHKINPGNPGKLRQGDKVFALTGMHWDKVRGGNYIGTSLTPDRQSYLYHDLQLQPHNYGTPLFDREGNVLGITTAPLHGKGRAIPIDVALRELKLLL